MIDGSGIMMVDYIEWNGKMGQEMFILSHFTFDLLFLLGG